jgi:hypothetical protein
MHQVSKIFYFVIKLYMFRDKIKDFGYLMYLVGYLYEDYHDARSLEHKVLQYKSWFFKLIISIFPLFRFVVNLPWLPSLSLNLYPEWISGNRIRQSVYVSGTQCFNPFTLWNSTTQSSLNLLAELQSWVGKGSKSPILEEGLF